MVRLLTDPAAAADLASIAFEVDTGHAIVTRRSGEAVSYLIPKDELQPGSGLRDTTHDPAPLITFRGVVSGDLFRALQDNIAWSLNGDATGDGDADDDQ
jgi:hypothetical protein